MDLHIPDLSKWQRKVDLSQVGPAVILRAYTGSSPDPTFRERQAAARIHQKVRGFYAFLIPDRDATAQARDAAAAIGRLQPGEFIVCDLEQGEGDQSSRAEAFCSTVDELCGGHSWVYSGESFAADHLRHVSGRLLWIAAYRAKEPTGPHALWQHTDHEPHPGVGPVDCSIFHGTIEQLHALVTPDVTPPVRHPFHAGIVPHRSYPDIAAIRARFQLPVPQQGAAFFDDQLSAFLRDFAHRRGIEYDRHAITEDLWKEIWR
jgi:GH25 family lysozyme M1 (1,4-beta-N-acetylmuramidase)